MTLIESLLQGRLILALGLFTIISIVIEILGYKLLATVSDVAPSHWIMEHITIPSARTLSLVIFILTAYPVLFGLETAPTLTELFAIDRMRLTNLVNVIFLLSLTLPMLPLISRLPAWILPIQGIAAATMVFRWLTNTRPELEIHYWPGLTTVAGIALLAFITHEIAKWLSHHLETRLDNLIHRAGSGRLIYRAVIMLLQVPVILVYTLSLGRQFH